MKASRAPYRIMISGGGTGGHIYPAIAIADALKAVAEVEILFVGAKGRMEMKKVPEAGYQIVGLWISGIQRKLSLKNLLFPFKLLSSLWKSSGLIKKFKPHAVVGVGGYASGPLLYVASRKRIPTLIQEQNSYAGLTNKWLAGRVQKICVAHDGMEKYFPENKLVITGNPVRNHILLDDARRKDSYEFFGFSPEKKTVFMTGGSLGARTMNEAMLAALPGWAEQDVQVIWQTGGFYYEEMKSRTEGMDMSRVYQVDFLREMDKAYQVADVVVARAGALSIAELELTGKASILIPSPNVAEDHQTKNALDLVNRDAALMLKDEEAIENLEGRVLELLDRENERTALSKNIRQLAKSRAAESIANEIMKLVG